MEVRVSTIIGTPRENPYCNLDDTCLKSTSIPSCPRFGPVHLGWAPSRCLPRYPPITESYPLQHRLQVLPEALDRRYLDALVGAVGIDDGRPKRHHLHAGILLADDAAL